MSFMEAIYPCGNRSFPAEHAEVAGRERLGQDHLSGHPTEAPEFIVERVGKAILVIDPETVERHIVDFDHRAASLLLGKPQSVLVASGQVQVAALPHISSLPTCARC